ncbi:WD40 repeat-like protein, partial [Fomitiporia mediterranea MF3/22]|uniref:WD40 repeat-like protein n=1 Tax=Fomitiporia mediterranea (strain MF3/22) TaxID=694068 RepID=UPI0004409168
VASASTNLITSPETCLGAPGLRDDFYTRLADWSKTDLLAVAMNSSVVYRNMQTQNISRVVSLDPEETVTCIAWSPSSTTLGVGLDCGLVRLYNPESHECLREYKAHRQKDFVGDLSWQDSNVFAVGYQSGQLRQFDVREQRGGRVIRSHRSRICGVEWNSDGRFLATGGGDGVVACWDARMDRPNPIATLNNISCRWRVRRHLSTVKAFAWCPWAPDMLASGGGTKDGTIRFWDVVRGCARSTVIPTHSQVTSLHFSQSCREIVSTHGYAFAPAEPGLDGVYPAPRRHSILVHNYPRGNLVGKVFDPAHGRITHSCLSPDGTRIVTCGSDDSIRMFKIFGKQNSPPHDEHSRLQSMIR